MLMIPFRTLISTVRDLPHLINQDPLSSFDIYLSDIHLTTMNQSKSYIWTYYIRLYRLFLNDESKASSPLRNRAAMIAPLPPANPA